MTNADQSPLNLGSSLSNTGGLQAEADALKAEIETLKSEKSRLLEQQLRALESICERLVQKNLAELEERQKTLQTSVEQLERSPRACPI